MDDIIIFSILTILGIVIILSAVYLFFIKRNRISSLFNELNEKYGFSVDLSKKHGTIIYPKASGEYRNRKIEIGLFDKADNGKATPHTYIKLSSMSNTDFSFIIQKRTRKNKINHSREEVKTEEDEFDKSFVVQSNQQGVMKKILDYTIRFKLIQASNIGYRGEMLLLGGEMIYIEVGIIKTKNDLLRVELLMHSMCDITDDIEQYTVLKDRSVFSENLLQQSNS